MFESIHDGWVRAVPLRWLVRHLEQEARTDLPPHTSSEIVELLKHESLAQTQARILVDGQRFWNSQGGRQVVR